MHSVFCTSRLGLFTLIKLSAFRSQKKKKNMAIVKLFVQRYVYNYSHTKTISKVWLVLTTLCYCPNYGLFFKINL